MPSVEKAILNPHDPLSVTEALLVAVCGMLVVFMMLAMLALVIIVISKAVGALEGKKKPAAPAPKKAAAPAAAPAAVPAAPAVDEGELVAVMMAAVAEESGMPMGSFQITNVAPVAAAPVAAAPAPAPAAAPVVAAPAASPAPVAAPVAAAPVVAPAAGETAVNSPMPGNVFKVECKAGQAVKAGDVLVVLEAMKMEIEVAAPVDGTVKAVSAVVGTAVNTDDLLVTIG